MNDAIGQVSLQDVSKSFTLKIEGKVQTVQALKSISFNVKQSEIVMLIGPSGCGKTTALRILMGLETATRGRVSVGGKEITGCGYDRGLVFQHAELLPWLTAAQNVMFGLEMKGMRGGELKDTAQRYLELVGLKDAANRRPYQLSGGMKQRVGIARALAMKPKVLLMDEPFGALDALTRAHLQDSVMQIQQALNTTIVLITHDVDEAVLLSDRVLMMTNGPAATVGEILRVDLPRPRNRVQLADDSRYHHMRQQILHFLYEKQPKAA